MKKIVTMRLDQVEYDALNLQAKKEGKSISAIMRDKLKGSLPKELDLTEVAKVLAQLFDAVEKLEETQVKHSELLKLIFRSSVRSAHAMTYCLPETIGQYKRDDLLKAAVDAATEEIKKLMI